MAYRPYKDYYKNKTEALDHKWLRFTSSQFNWIMNDLHTRYSSIDTFSVIDLGCGTGRLLAMIQNDFPNAQLHGIDGTPEMINKAQTLDLANAKFECLDLTEYTPVQTYDVVISTTVLHHLDAPPTHIQMIQDTLVIDGVAYISEFAMNTIPLKVAELWWDLTQPSHKQSWSVEKLQSLIQSNKLRIMNHDILRPDKFWQLQIYSLAKQKGLIRQ